MLRLKTVQEKLYADPKEPDQALEFAIGFAEGVKRQKAYGTQVPESVQTVVKSEPDNAVEKTHPREFYKCGKLTNFTMGHVNFCMATNHRCNFCETIGHVEKCCNKKFPQRHEQMMQRIKNRDNAKHMRRVNYIEESGKKSEGDEEQLVL